MVDALLYMVYFCGAIIAGLMSFSNIIMSLLSFLFPTTNSAWTSLRVFRLISFPIHQWKVIHLETRKFTRKMKLENSQERKAWIDLRVFRLISFPIHQ